MTNFIDYVKIYCRSGKGGAGSMHFHRAKYLPKGGPDGGDGGKGGSIILHANRNLWTLLHLKYQKHLFATDGGNGGDSRSFGKDGEDKIIEVPCGTVVYDGDTGEFLCEVKEHDERIVLLKGGREAWATGISAPLPTRLRVMHSLENRRKSEISSSNSKCWQMSDW